MAASASSNNGAEEALLASDVEKGREPAPHFYCICNILEYRLQIVFSVFQIPSAILKQFTCTIKVYWQLCSCGACSLLAPVYLPYTYLPELLPALPLKLPAPKLLEGAMGRIGRISAALSLSVQSTPTTRHEQAHKTEYTTQAGTFDVCDPHVPT